MVKSCLRQNSPQICPEIFGVLSFPHSFEKVTRESMLVEGLSWYELFVLGTPHAFTQISTRSCNGVLKGFGVINSLVREIVQTFGLDFFDPVIRGPAIRHDY